MTDRPFGGSECAQRENTVPWGAAVPAKPCGQYVSVSESDVRVRMTESRQLAERREHFGLARLGEVEQPGTPRVKSVRQQVSIGRHLGFGVMRMCADHPRRQRRDDATVMR